jgi:UDP-N-acetyl-D-glucosamine dehydrogenase
VELASRINARKAHVVVLGLGYVGLPSAKHYIEKGYSVTGFDVSKNKVRQLNLGESYIQDVDDVELQSMLLKGFQATTESTILGTADVIVVCVPTPIDECKKPDLSFVESAGEMIAEYAGAGCLVILESTTYPGTTETYIAKPLEQKGFTVGNDVFVAYSPERIDPGNATYSLDNTPKVVGGMTEACLDLAAGFIGETAHPVRDVRVAELSKVFENTFRWVNIALVNEMAEIAHTLGLDVWEVLEAAESKPYGFMRFNPGIGVGGHCIPVDPYYLTHVMKEKGRATKMIDLAGEINDGMIEHVYLRLFEWLNEKGTALSQARITVIGAAYKKNIGDLRESPAVKLIDCLSSQVGYLEVVDPYLEDVPSHIPSVEYRSILDPNRIAISDLVLIATPHDCIDFEEVRKNSKLIFDTQNIFEESIYDSPNVRKL